MGPILWEPCQAKFSELVCLQFHDELYRLYASTHVHFFSRCESKFKGTLHMFGMSPELISFKNWQLPLGQLYSGRDKSDCPLPCTIAATVVRSSLVHGSNETVGFELGFYPDVEVEKLYKVALILVPLHFQ